MLTLDSPVARLFRAADADAAACLFPQKMPLAGARDADGGASVICPSARGRKNCRVSPLARFYGTCFRKKSPMPIQGLRPHRAKALGAVPFIRKTGKNRRRAARSRCDALLGKFVYYQIVKLFC
jgi:hypothetical protein